MTTHSTQTLAGLLTAVILLVPTVGCSQTAAPVAPPESKLQPLTGELPPQCETCGTVVAINRVDADELPTNSTIANAPPSPKREIFEIVVRLSAGTQQIVTVDSAPKLSIGQRVRITDGVVLPDLV